MSKAGSKLSISQKIATLDESVEWFYSEEFSLDQALQKYKDANKLALDIKEDQSKLKNQIEVIGDFTKS